MTTSGGDLLGLPGGAGASMGVGIVPDSAAGRMAARTVGAARMRARPIGPVRP